MLDRFESLEAQIEGLREVSRPSEVIIYEDPDWQALAGWVSTGTVLRSVDGQIVMDPTITRIKIGTGDYIESEDYNPGVSGFQIDGAFDSDPEWRSLENIALSARVGAEMSADFIKTPHAAGFERVTRTTYVPVVILGGAKRGSERATLQDIKTAVDAGASGVAIGRNIFQAPDQQAMTAAIAAVLQQSASVEQAMAMLER